MKKKQWVWLLIAAVVFAGVGVANVVSDVWRQKNAADAASGLLSAFTVLDDPTYIFPEEDFVARVNIEGAIVSDSSQAGLLGLNSEGYDQAYLLDYIDRLAECPNNKGILLYVNSGGGEMGASDEMYLKLLDYKAATGRPIYAYFDSVACSGAYYIAMAADEIWANRNSICVNIGVYISTYDLSGLFDRYGIESVMIRSSENKGIGATGQPWTEEHRAIYQSIVDLYYQQFLDVVAQGRDLTADQVRQKDDGREMLASQALEAGLIDGIGRYEEYKDRVLASFGDDAPELYEEEQADTSPLGRLLGGVLVRLEQLRPASDLDTLQRFAQEQEGFTVMAYAG